MFVQRLQTLFKQKVAAVSKSFVNVGREELVKICGSISKCVMAAKDRLERLVGGDLSSSGAKAAVIKADESGEASGGASGVGPSK